ncbi:MAG: transmembrane repetitive protein, partial [Pseudomonadota bacterium]|nr:transmembrane repetitive protein [Pseudomonadota bacterium]
QEWVRRGIKTLSIPIPGTSKRLECVVSILQAGGGCGLSDSEKLFEQPAIARPPPAIPFKPELHENQGDLKK